MPYHDRAKARMEHEVTILRREVATLRSKQEQRRRAREEQVALQARLEQEVQVLQNELAAARCDREERECGGAEQCSLLTERLEKLDGHVVKQERYIAFLEEQINHTRTKYQQRMSDVRQNAELVEKELKRVRREMRTIAEQAGELDRLQKELGFLNGKLDRRNAIISKYEAQHEEMLAIVAGLQNQLVEKERIKGGGNASPGHRRRTRVRKEKEIAPDKPPVFKDKLKADPSKSDSNSFVYLSTALKKKAVSSFIPPSTSSNQGSSQ
ncbi:myosin heavy chain, striated muscle [Drosophila rhopaloa]|uniref:Myosin heavy chain, striated muscle n=1 Tax=Drosophila rhopaloa TaxID=1041015 RepID=A0A6P4FLD9_DRORH|nr:myosin heavy chain, striated muscle [Drosophila rhopaloa]